MTLPPAPDKLTREEFKTLMEKFKDHSISEERKERQEMFREKIRENDF